MLTSSNKYSYLILLTVGLVIGFYICCLFNSCGSHSTTAHQAVVQKPEVTQRRVAAVQAVYQFRIDSLNAVTKNLQASLQTTQTVLGHAKKKNIVLQTQIYDLLDRASLASPDTASRLADCDSLKSRVQDLVTNDNAKDSLYEDATTNLQEQLTNKDSTIRVQQEEYQALKASFNQSLQDQQLLLDANKDLQKSIRHQKFKGTLKTIGLTIAAVLATHYLIHP